MFRENCRGVFHRFRFHVFIPFSLSLFDRFCQQLHNCCRFSPFSNPKVLPDENCKKTPWSFSWNTEGHTDALVLAIVGMAHYELGTVCTLEGVAPHEICSKCEHC